MHRPLYSLLVTASMLLVVTGCGPSAPTIDERLAALPELPEQVRSTLDTATLATRTPPITLPAFLSDTTRTAALAPCCGMTETYRLHVLYEVTWCRHPMRDILIDDLPFALSARRGDDKRAVPPVRYTQLERERRGIIERFFCTTSSGPWEAEVRATWPCHGGPYKTLVISTPAGLIGFPAWQGEVQDLPGGAIAVDCQWLDRIKSPCGGLGNCSCLSSQCEDPAGCPCGP